MRNRYPGQCYRCGKTVDAGKGHFERRGKGWRVQHAHCAIAYRGTDHTWRAPAWPDAPATEGQAHAQQA